MEHSIETHIGDEIPVTVWFDYDPEQHQTYWEPGFCSEVCINAVCVDGNQDKEIETILIDETLESLRLKCFEHMETEQEPHE